MEPTKPLKGNITHKDFDEQGNITQQKMWEPVLKLRNVRNSCFINSSLQLLLSIPEVKKFFSIGLTGSPVEQPVSWEISRLVKAKTLSDASRLRYLVSRSTGDIKYDRGTEEDSCEFLTTLIHVLQSELKHDQAGLNLLQRFWGLEKTNRKFLDR